MNADIGHSPSSRMLKKPITTDYVNVHGDVNKNGTRIDADFRGKKAEKSV